MKHLVGLGLVNHDTVASTEGFEVDSKVRATALFEQVGGPVPVALQCAARFGGIRATHLGVVGSDSLSDDLVLRLESFGVIAKLQRTAPSTSRSLVLLDVPSGTRLVANYAEQLPPFQFDDEAIEILHSADLLHVDGRDVAGALFAAQATKGKISLDLGTMRAGLEALFPFCDVLIASRKGGAGAFPYFADEPLAQVRGFLDAGATIAGVTLGAGGLALGWHGGPEPFLVPPYLTTAVVDTCGAGDTFHGAFCHAYLAGASPLEAGQFAQAAVCVRIGRLGNEAGLPMLGEVSAFRAEFSPAR